jgi:D-amino-acid dehydrogenase
MRVIVIGAGVIGVCSAYQLRRAGCEVTVLERNAGVASEASFANAGVIAPGYVTPWAAPGMPFKIASYLFKGESPVVFRPNLDPALWRWLLRWMGECRLERFKVNKSRMQRVASYSRDVLHQLAKEHQLDYQRTNGVLQLFRTAADRRLAEPGLALLKDAGVEHRLLDANACRKVEPGISDLAFEGGLYLPHDEAGNCPLFARQLRDVALREGAVFRFGQRVTAIDASAAVKRVKTASETYQADAVVVAGGVDSVALLAPLGIKVPLYPIKGYSATVTVREATYAPQAALMDEAYKVAMVRMGNRIRIAGTAELGSRQLSLRDSALRTLVKVARDWFPGAADYREPNYWVGARPMLPDGAPLIGATSQKGIFLNLGHGSTGWAMACGSGRLVADSVTGRPSEIDMDGLTLSRYAS